MGLPNINIIFREQAIAAIQRGQRGVVALILREEVPEIMIEEMVSVAEIPEDISDYNKQQIRLAFMGYTVPPRKVIACIIPQESLDYAEAQHRLETIKWDYVAIPSISESETMDFASWIKSLRDTKGIRVKAVLPDTPGDHEGIINVTIDNIVDNSGREFSTAEYCSRFAGLFAGTSLTIASTFAPLPEVVECDNLIIEELDDAIDNGEMTLYNDGEKIKVARGVNSLVTTTEVKGELFQKIKIVDAMDMIFTDIKRTAEDNYLGKYSNSYDNKCLLILAIQGYFETLEQEGILESGTSSVEIDIEANAAYLKSIGTDTNEMEAHEIKTANTRDKVFLKANITILDAIEEISLPINI